MDKLFVVSWHFHNSALPHSASVTARSGSEAWDIITHDAPKAIRSKMLLESAQAAKDLD